MTAHASDSIVAPANYAIRLSLRPPQSRVVVAPPDVKPTPEGVLGTPSVSTMLTQDAGVSWPDATGAAGARRMLAAGGSVCLVFWALADAMTCHARLLRERTG